MNKRIKDKIKQIERYIEELSEIKPKTLKDYLNDFKTKAACERYFEKIIEGVVDMALLVIKDKGLQTPEDDSQAFDILAKENIIDVKLSEKLKDAKGMRNIIAHQYGTIDDEIVFIAVTQEIQDDVNSFIKNIKSY